ncbi:MAG: efflux RND transporter periplasmic adaptor subunit [Acidobacteriia bacterium]|nr:efflux RND transporter periplasmic adaptor subunit [Terriglobia bacterium]
MKKFRWILAVLLPLGAAGCGTHPAPPAAGAPGDAGAATTFVLPADAQGVQTMTVAATRVAGYTEVSARIAADPTTVIRVYPPVGGRLVAVKVKPGDRVRKGQVLAELQSSDVAAARSDYLKARTDAEIKRKSRDRAKLLYDNQVYSEKDYQQAVADAEMAQAELNRAETALRVLDISPSGTSEHFSVVAPRDGVILDIGASAGEFSKSLDAPAPVCTLADLSHVWAVGDLFEKDLAALQVGAQAEVRVSAYPDRKWTERVEALSGALDPVTRTLKVRVQLQNADRRLKPEMFASIRLLRPAKDVLLIPADAVLRDGAAAFVFVRKAGRTFERRAVTLGDSRDAQVEVNSGLQPGDVIVSEGAFLLRAAS